MNRDHTTIDELLAARALDGLEPEEMERLERAMAEHGDCETCRRLDLEHRETAALLAFALEPRPMDPAIAGRIAADAPSPAGRPIDRRVRRWQLASGLAAAVAAVLAIALITKPGPTDLLERIVTFEGGAGDLAAAYAPGQHGVLVWGSDLPSPGRGMVYELWLIDDGAASRGACLEPRDGSLGAFVDADVSGADALALTVESTSCPDAPTMDPLYTAALH